MNTKLPPAGDDERFDQAMRALHARAVDQVSPATRARLRAARHGAVDDSRSRKSHRGYGWLLASGCAAAVVLAIALQLQPRPVTQPAPSVADAGYDADTALATLDENPDLYLWLASNDDALPAAEQ